MVGERNEGGLCWRVWGPANKCQKWEGRATWIIYVDGYPAAEHRREVCGPDIQTDLTRSNVAAKWPRRRYLHGGHSSTTTCTVTSYSVLSASHFPLRREEFFLLLITTLAQVGIPLLMAMA
ncbi:hypothetical protein SUGI_0324230 [Cryptomeria japonica]|nr:hypothetical protein SUGI_0324230 [Cryptomeria japonica]